MLDGKTPNASDIPSTEPTVEISSPVVHSCSSLSFNSISLIIICKCNNDVCDSFDDTLTHQAEGSVCMAIIRPIIIG